MLIIFGLILVIFVMVALAVILSNQKGVPATSQPEVAQPSDSYNALVQSTSAQTSSSIDSSEVQKLNGMTSASKASAGDGGREGFVQATSGR